MALKIRRGTSKARIAMIAGDPQEGELVFDTDTNILYIGDSAGTPGGITVGNSTSTTPVGNNAEIQYKSGSSLSANSSATVITNPNVLLTRGYSGNFVYYTESITAYSYPSVISGTTNFLEVPFGTCNVFTVDAIRLNTSTTKLTITGFTNMTTGQSMTLILGHTGVNGSVIEIPQGLGIWWAGGVIGGFGSTSSIYPGANKRYDVITFFDDGYRIFANYSLNYSQ